MASVSEPPVWFTTGGNPEPGETWNVGDRSVRIVATGETYILARDYADSALYQWTRHHFLLLFTRSP